MNRLKKHIIPITVIILIAACLGSGILGFQGSKYFYRQLEALSDAPWTLQPDKKYDGLYVADDGKSFSYHESLDEDFYVRITIDKNGKELGREKIADEVSNPKFEDYDFIEGFTDGFSIAQSSSRDVIINEDGKIVYSDDRIGDIEHIKGTLYFVSFAGYIDTPHSQLIYDAALGESIALDPNIQGITAYGDIFLGEVYSIGDAFLDEDFHPLKGSKYYQAVGEYSEGLRYVEVVEDRYVGDGRGSSEENTTVCGYEDEDGNLIITLDSRKTVYNANKFSGGKAIIYRNGSVCAIDRTGKELWSIPRKKNQDELFLDDYLLDSSYCGGYAPIIMASNKFTFVDEAGNPVRELYYESIENAGNGLCVVGLHNKYGILDLKEGF